MSCTAAWNQKAFRGRNDDGNETTATWKAAQNINWNQAKDVNLRIRLEVQETAGCAKANFTTIQLQYNLNGAGWVNVSASSSVVRSSASPNLADGASTTNQLTVGTGTFVGGGGFDEVNGVAGSSAMDVSASGHFEVEYCVQIRSADVANGDTIQLRASDGGSAFAAYDATPSITVDSGAVSVATGLGALIATGLAPTATASDHQTVTPALGALVASGLAPTITASDHQTATPGLGALVATGFEPTVSVSSGTSATPGLGELVATGFAPTISVSDNQTAAPGVGALAANGFAPTVTASDHQTADTGLGALTVTGFAPVVTASDNQTASPALGSLIATGYEPTVTATSHQTVTPALGELIATGFAPVVTASDHQTVTPGVGAGTLTGFAPTVTGGTGTTASPGTGELEITGHEPTVTGVVTVTSSGRARKKDLRYTIEHSQELYDLEDESLILGLDDIDKL